MTDRALNSASPTTPIERGDEDVVRAVRERGATVLHGDDGEATEALYIITESELNRMVAELERLRERGQSYDAGYEEGWEAATKRRETELTDLRRQVEAKETERVAWATQGRGLPEVEEGRKR